MRVLGSLLLVAACAGTAPSQEPAAEPAVNPRSAGKEIVGRLHYDEEIELGPFRVGGLRLRDSRCPRGARCVWEGEVIAHVDLSSETTAARTVELTLRAGSPSDSEEIGDYLLRLLSVEPYPRAGVQPERSEVVARLGLIASGTSNR